MESTRTVYFFADGSQETQGTLRKVLRSRKPNTFLSIFLNNVRDALRDEVRQLPFRERIGLPDFHSIDEFVEVDFDESRRHPALHPTEIVLAQLSIFISAFEAQPEAPWPRRDEDVVVGVCIGELSAAAISLSSGLAGLLSIGAEVVRIAFRAGLLASKTGQDLEAREQPARSWSATVSRHPSIDTDAALEDLCQSIGLLGRRRLCITFANSEAVTIGGSPSALETFFENCEQQPYYAAVRDRKEVRIFAPYHSPILYERNDITTLITNAITSRNAFTSDAFSHPVNGHICAGGTIQHIIASRRGYIEDVLFNIFAEPIKWDDMISECSQRLGASPTPNWQVRPFGQTGAARKLASILATNTGKAVKFDPNFALQSITTASPTQEPIAVVGMSGRFPGCDSTDALWEMLMTGQDCHKEIPKDRFDPATHLERPAYGCFMDQPGLFDPRFFNISPREALETDPGQRLALVTAYEALEMAGFVANRTPSSKLDRVGTFFGQTSDEYKEVNVSQKVGTYFIPGTIRAFGPGRINHFFKFGGPAISFDTACSSSSVAMHMACTSIWGKECDTAVVGGMSVISSSDNYNGLSAGHFLSPSGNCKTFDDGADGYCRGEAVVAVVLKPLSAAIADNDKVLGTILSASTNYSHGTSSITHPWAPAQQALYQKVLDDARVEANDVSYVELHGTGTQAGDAVEMSSILNTFAKIPRAPSNPLALGAVKANLGHGEAASGVTSFIKALMVLQQKVVPPHAGIKGQINHKFPDLSALNVHIHTTAALLPAHDGTRPMTMLVNNFSAAGGNTAFILAEAPSRTKAERHGSREQHPVVISAKSKKALLASARRLQSYIRSHPNTSIADLSYTTTARRRHHTYRAASNATSLHDLVRDFDPNGFGARFGLAEKNPQVAFVFTGQGAFQLKPAQILYETCKLFKETVLRFEAICRSYGYPPFAAVLEPQSSLDLASLPVTAAHLVMITIQMSLYELFLAFGIKPTLVMGHSFGEYGALYASGVLSANDVLFLVGQRAMLLQSRCSPGTHAMLAIRAGEGKVRNVLGDDLLSLQVACFNGPRDIVLTGPKSLISEAATTLKSQSITCSILEVPFAYHSSQMDAILDDLEIDIETLRFNKPKIPVASALLGEVVSSDDVFSAAYIRRHIRDAVDFVGAVETCYNEDYLSQDASWLEIGTHPICSGMLKASLGPDLQVNASMHRDNDPWTTIGNTLSELYLNGHDINWQVLFGDLESSVEVLHLPSYPWDNENYWIPYENDWLLNRGEIVISRPATSHSLEIAPLTTTLHRLVQEELTECGKRMVFETDFATPALHALVKGHAVGGTYLCPASVYADIAMTVADQARNSCQLSGPLSAMSVKRMEISHPITVPAEIAQKPQIVRIIALVDTRLSSIDIEFCTEDGDKSAKCSVSFGDTTSWQQKWARSKYLIARRLKDIQADIADGQASKLGRGVAYMLFSSLVSYSTPFQGMDQVFMNSDELEASAILKLPLPEETENYFYGPYWIDSFVQLSGLVLNANDKFRTQDVVFISHGWHSMQLPPAVDPAKRYWVHVKMQNTAKDIYTGTLHVLLDGEIVGTIKDLKFRQMPRRLLTAVLPPSRPSTPAPIPERRISSSSTKASPLHQRQSRYLMSPQQSRSTSRSSQFRPSKRSSAAFRRESTGFDQFKTILTVLSEETAVPLVELTGRVAFSDIGVDSLLTLTAMARLRNEFRIDLPKTLFIDCTTIGDLQHLLAQEQGYESDGVESVFSQPAYPSNRALITPVTPMTDEDEEPILPKDDRLPMLRDIIAKQIGISVAELVEIGDFTSLGVDSIMRLSVAAEIKEKLGLDTPAALRQGIATLAELEQAYLTTASQSLNVPRIAPMTRRRTLSPRRMPQRAQITVTDMSPAISRVRSASARPTTPSSSFRAVRNIGRSRRPSSPPVAKSKALSVVLHGNPATCRQFLFLFPDGSGSATAYVNLTSLPQDTCVIGLDSPYLREGPDARFTVASIVATWLRDIRKYQPQGPYNFAGWSAGGYYAYEATRRMLEAGELVDRLIVIDSPPRNAYEALPQKLLCAITKNNILGSDNAAEKKPAPQWLVDHFNATIQAVGAYEPVALRRDDVEGMRVYAIWATAGALEKNGRIDTSGWDMSTKVSRFLLNARRDFGPNGWDELLPGADLSVAKVSGTHFSMVQEPNCHQLSKLISAAMEEDLADRFEMSD